MSLLIARAEVEARRVDVRVAEGRVVAVEERLRPRRDEEVVDARGAALLPGLHDHHLHVLATAAAADGVDCGPPAVRDLTDLARALRDADRGAPGATWLRGSGYTETVAGRLDRDVLDRLVPARPVRVQHRSGSLWMLNSAALQAIRLTDEDADPDVERDTAGRLTGRLWRYDMRLRERLGVQPEPDVAAVSRRLAEYGITGVTDATPDLTPEGAALLTGGLQQQVLLLGAPEGAELPPGASAGPSKLLLRDHDLPSLDELTGRIGAVHARGRAVAVHCVTRESLLLTVIALEQAGARRGDRIEHGAVVPPELRGRLAALDVAVVTQPTFVAQRGDDYLADVEPEDRPLLYPYASLLAAGVRVAGSSDAPYGDLDPWRGIEAARDRRTPSGAVLGAAEQVTATTALRGLLSPLRDPGGRPRQVAPGADADLCLLSAPLERALDEPTAEQVRLVLRAGAVLVGG